MSEYTPTTEEVRLEYMAVRWAHSETVSFEARAEFDRWLVAHDREVAAKAWAEGARWAAVECGVIEHEREAWLTDDDNPYRKGQGDE